MKLHTEKRRNRAKKAQVTTELVIITSIVFVIFLLTLLIINDRNDHIIEYRKYLSAKDIAEDAAFMINEVYISGFGARNFIFLPARLSDGTDYTLTVYPQSRVLSIDWDEHHYVAPLVTSHISGLTTPISGRYEAYNRRGEIILEQ